MVCARKRAWPTRFDETTLFVCTGTLFDLVAVMWREPPGRVELLARCSEGSSPFSWMLLLLSSGQWWADSFQDGGRSSFEVGVGAGADLESS